MPSQVAGDLTRKRIRSIIHNEEYLSVNTTASKRQKSVSAPDSEDSTSPLSSTSSSPDPEEKSYHVLLRPRPFSLPTNIILGSKTITLRQAARQTIGQTKTLRSTPSDNALLRNILAYDHTTRRPTFDLSDCLTSEDRQTTDFHQITLITWRLICEYSKLSTDLPTLFSSITAIQTYLTRTISNSLLLPLSPTSPYPLKCKALETLIQITFQTLSNDPAVIGINGLLHARVGEWLGEAMVRVVECFGDRERGRVRGDKERRVWGRLVELRRLVRKLRWPIEGVERCVEMLRAGGQGGRLRRVSFLIFRKGVC